VTAAVPYPRFDGTQACAQLDVDPELFFTGGDPTQQAARLRDAIAVCTGCSFREPCAAYALTHDVNGVWGGTTEPTRREVQRKHGIQPRQLEVSDTGTRAEEVRRLASAGTPPPADR